MSNGNSAATPDRTGSLEWIIQAVGHLLQPLETPLAAAEIQNLIYVDLGISLPAGTLGSTSITTTLAAIGTAASQLPDQISSLNSALNENQVDVAAQQAAKLVQEIQTTVVAISKLVAEMDNLSGKLSGITDAQLQQFAADLPARILELLTINYLDEYLIRREWLLLLGLLEQQLIPIDPQHPEQGFFVREQLYPDRLLPLLSTPLAYAKTVYGWGDASFQANLLLDRVSKILALTKLPATLTPGTAATPASLEFFMFTLRENRQGSVPGLELDLKMPIAAGFDFTLPVSSAFSVEFSSTGQFEAGLRLILQPPYNLTLLPVSATLNGSLQARLVGQNQDTSQPFVILGATGGSRLEAAQVALGLGLSASMATGAPSAQGDVVVDAEITNGKLILDTSGEDGFLSSVVPNAKMEADLDFGASWSPAKGLTFKGSGGLEIAVAVNQSIGPVELQKLYLVCSLVTNPNQIALEVSGAFSGKIVALSVAVDRLGFVAHFSMPPGGGNVGPVAFDLSFKPPSGVGLAIDSAGVSGGGYLAHDDSKHEYSGVLQLQFTDLALQAFGLITTQVAGQSGYSLLALIDANFPPVQLGWGFTLNGVGGLLAVNRAASTDALQAAVKANTLSSILFPRNAITNAPQVLSTLDAIFPTAPGRFLFGPMALIGWGTPPVFTAAIAVIVELPEPIVIILIARLSLRLPSESEALVRINLDALGVLDLSQHSLSLDAKLFDSKLLDFNLSGDMALRANWGSSSQREFLLAIGGFHPNFSPPAGFPTLQRITIDMPSGPVSKLRLAAYLALTSNTVQFGATLDVFIGVSGFGLAGHLGFDALLEIDPFHFDADISGRVALTAGGDDLMSVALDATLSGPAPWHIAGDFKVHIVFFDVGVQFSYSWGEDAPAPQIAPVQVLPLLTAALADTRNWGATLPAGTSALVSVKDTGSQIVHPLARLEVHESVVPLGLAITRFGSASVAGPSTFTIGDYQVNGSSVDHEAIEDDFAPAQFFDLSDDEKLAGPSFEQHDAGVRLTGIGLTTCGGPVSKTISYETFYVDQPGVIRTDPVTPPKTFVLGELTWVLATGASARAPIRTAGDQRYTAPGTPVKILPQKFVIADQVHLTFAGVGAPQGSTYSEAAAQLKLAVAQNAASGAGLQIVATHELVTT